MAIMDILALLVHGPLRRDALAAFAPVQRQLLAVAQILQRKSELERKYLDRLEGRPLRELADPPNDLVGCDIWSQRVGHAGVPQSNAAPPHRTGQKGSDVLAREATVKLVAVTQQHTALQDLLTSLGARGGTPKAARPPGSSGKVLGRNMIVRGALAELTNAQLSHARLTSP